jgi:hypothetical protein
LVGADWHGLGAQGGFHGFDAFGQDFGPGRFAGRELPGRGTSRRSVSSARKSWELARSEAAAWDQRSMKAVTLFPMRRKLARRARGSQ